MSQSEETKVELNIDADLINAAEAELEKLPKTANEIIEKWIYLGRAVASQLSEEEQLLLMAGSGKVKVKQSEKHESNGLATL
jgi:cell division protein FtsI/penicillin-binding protein 2